MPVWTTSCLPVSSARIPLTTSVATHAGRPAHEEDDQRPQRAEDHGQLVGGGPGELHGVKGRVLTNALAGELGIGHREPVHDECDRDRPGGARVGLALR